MFGIQALIPSWEAKVLVSLLVAVFAYVLVHTIHRKRHALVQRFNPVFVDLTSSLFIIGVVIATTLVLADLWGQTETLLEQMGFLRLDQRAPQLVITIVVLIAIRVFAGIVSRLLDDLTHESEALTDHQREVSLRLTQLTLWGAGLVVILGVWQVDLTGLLVGAGFLGIVIGMAARKTIGSLLAGFVLMFSRPFEVGDWILVDGHEGTVTDITMMSTRIEAFNGEYVVVPNDVVSNETVVNRSRRDRYRVDVEVGVDYAADLDRVRETALKAAQACVNRNEDILSSPEPDVLFREFGDSSIGLVVRTWIKAPSPARSKQLRDDLLCTIKAAFDEEGINIPYPQRELSGREETGGFRLAEPEGDRQREPSRLAGDVPDN